jgi:hypothetical protein
VAFWFVHPCGSGTKTCLFPSFLFIRGGGIALLKKFQGTSNLIEIKDLLLFLSENPDVWRVFVSSVQEENQ